MPSYLLLKHPEGGYMGEDLPLIIAVSALKKAIEHHPGSWLWKGGDRVRGEWSGEAQGRVKRWRRGIL